MSDGKARERKDRGADVKKLKGTYYEGGRREKVSQNWSEKL